MEPPVELEHAIGFSGECHDSLFFHPNRNLLLIQ